MQLEVAGSVALGSMTALPLMARGSGLAAHGSRLRVHLLSLLSDSLLISSFPGGDDWASGGAICHVFAQPFAGDERILQVCPPLLFPSSARDGAPRTLTKLSVFGSESSHFFEMPRATSDAKLLIQSLNKAYAATPTNLKVCPT